MAGIRAYRSRFFVDIDISLRQPNAEACAAMPREESSRMERGSRPSFHAHKQARHHPVYPGDLHDIGITRTRAGRGSPIRPGTGWMTVGVREVTNKRVITRFSRVISMESGSPGLARGAAV
jgi:hypothetical protein